MLEIRYKRYYPRGFFNSNNEKLGIVSISEQLSRAIITHTLQIPEEKIVAGNPLKKQPDYIIGRDSGLEVTFAASTQTIEHILSGLVSVTDIEEEVITSILDACRRKRGKILEGNYASVKDTSLFMIELDPIWPWYQEYFGDARGSMATNRDMLLTKLYNDYIYNKVFADIYILILTEMENYILLDVRAFAEKYSEGQWISEIQIINKNVLPYYKATSLVPTDGPDIHYIVEDIVWF